MTALSELRAVVAALPTTATTSTGWSAAQHLRHCAESVGASLDGFPRLSPWIVRATVGPLALAVILARGRLGHDVVAPLPGAAPPRDGPLDDARAELLAAIDRFEARSGPLAPHAVFGAIGKERFARFHALHLAEHLAEIGR